MDPRSASNNERGRGRSDNRIRSRGGRSRGGTGSRNNPDGRVKKAPKEEPDSYSTLGKLVSQATTPTKESGYKHLNEELVRRIKGIAKQDGTCAASAFTFLMLRMSARSSEVRYMTLSVLGELFQRSKVVRAALVADLKNFLNLAVGHDARQPLPGPAAAADALRQRALALLEEWNDAHGDMYKGLRAAYRFLREGRRMKFPELQVRAAREREEAAKREKHAERLLRAKYLQAKREIQEQIPELAVMVREMQECFSILVPTVPGTDAIFTDGSHSRASKPSSTAAAASISNQLSRASSSTSSSIDTRSDDPDQNGSAPHANNKGLRRRARSTGDGVGSNSNTTPPLPLPSRTATARHCSDDGSTRPLGSRSTLSKREGGGNDEGGLDGDEVAAGDAAAADDDDDAAGMEWEDGGGVHDRNDSRTSSFSTVAPSTGKETVERNIGGRARGSAREFDGSQEGTRWSSLATIATMTPVTQEGMTSQTGVIAPGEGSISADGGGDSDDDEGIEWEEAAGKDVASFHRSKAGMVKGKGRGKGKGNEKGKGGNGDGKGKSNGSGDFDDGSDAEISDDNDWYGMREGDDDDDEEAEEAGHEEWARSEKNNKRRRHSGGQGLRSVADTVEAAGLGSAGYELQIEVPMGWSISTNAEDGAGEETALVLSALRERYKVLTSRILPLISDWIHTLSRVTFDTSSLNTAPATATGGGSARTPEREAAVAERRICSSLLSRCLAARNAANTVVSKFLELKVDGGGGAAETAARHPGWQKRGDNVAGGGSAKGGWGAVGVGSSAAFGVKKPRLQIHLDKARAGGDSGDR